MLQMKHDIIQYTVHSTEQNSKVQCKYAVQCGMGSDGERRSVERLFVHVYSNAIDNCTVRRWQINGCNSFVIVFFAFVHVVWGNFPFGSRNFLLDFYLSLYLTICTYTLPFGCFGRLQTALPVRFVSLSFFITLPSVHFVHICGRACINK